MNRDSITKQLRDRREALGLSQQDAAILIDVSRVTYIGWEKDPLTMPLGKYDELITKLSRLEELKK